MHILGIHGNFGRSEHDTAAALIADGHIVAAAEEERFIRQKHASCMMPELAIRFCLDQAGISIRDVDVIAFPRATWKNFKERLESFFIYRFGHCPKVVFVHHHKAHGAIFFVSGFSRALVVSVDQSGDGVSLAIYLVAGQELRLIHEELYPNSLGLFAAAMTQYLGFRSNDSEYKVMGLAAYGKPVFDLDFLLEVNNSEFHFHDEFLHEEARRRFPEFSTEQLPILNKEVEAYLPSRRLGRDPIHPEHADLAASVQKKIEDAVISVLRKYKEPANSCLCLCGGVAQNSLMVGKIVRSGMFDSIYLPPAAGDAGTALGAAVYVAVAEGYSFKPLRTSLLGPAYTQKSIKESLVRAGARFCSVEDPAAKAAEFLSENKIITWFQDRAEFGPRALGGRSLLANPSNNEMKSQVNAVKQREEFRPFGPSILHEEAPTYIECYHYSPFMSFALQATERGLSAFPAAVHCDGSTRLQSVDSSQGQYYHLLKEFYSRTGIPAILNTSLNDGRQPIVLSPEDALGFFFSSPIDYLVIGNYIVAKR